MEALTRKLKNTLVSMQDIHQSHSNHLERVRQDLEGTASSIPMLEKQSQEAGERYQFFQVG